MASNKSKANRRKTASKADTKVRVSPKEREAGILARLLKALSKAGVDRTRVFTSTLGKPVYAYSVYPKDPTKFVREDASGHKTVGRFVNGRFRSLSSASAD